MAKGLCFLTAGQMVLHGDIPDLTLCHGKVVGAAGEAEGQEYIHAWTEIGDWVLDPEVDLVARRERYYEVGQVRDVQRYTRDELVHIVAEYGHWGPWPDGKEEEDTAAAGAPE